MDLRMRYRCPNNDHLLGHQHYKNNSGRVGPVYTMCGGTPTQQQNSSIVGAQLLMNTPNVATATQFQFIPGRRNFMTSAAHDLSSAPHDTDATWPTGLFTVMPLINSIKGFFTNLMRPKVDGLDSAHREFNSAPNIMNISPAVTTVTPKNDLSHSNDFDGFDAHILATTTKSFSDTDLQISAGSSRIIQDLVHEMPMFPSPLSQLPQPIQSAIPATVCQIAKETQPDKIGQLTASLRPPTIKLAGRRQRKNKRTNNHRKPGTTDVSVMKHVVPSSSSSSSSSSSEPQNPLIVTLPSTTCTIIKPYHHKKPDRSSTKNKKEKNRHELAWNIHEDIEGNDRCDAAAVVDEDTVDFARIENIPFVVNLVSQPCSISDGFTCFTAIDFPAIRQNTKVLSATQKKACQQPATPPPSPTLPSTPPPQTTTRSSCSWEIPIRSLSCLGSTFAAARRAAIAAKLANWRPNHRQRHISDCDTEDNFIVFTNGGVDDGQASSSVESTLSLCDGVRTHFAENERNSRRMSESSDDFICFEMEDDEDDIDGDDDDFSEDETDSEVDDTIEETLLYGADSDIDVENDDDDDDGKSIETNQPDSGFEEKKHLHVRFNPKPEIHIIRTWNYAYRQARKSYWEQIGRDRVRFHDRVNRMATILNPILATDHRQHVFTDRYV